MRANHGTGTHPVLHADPTGGTEVPIQAARDLLARFARAIQRATIYPDGHPATRVATAPLVDTLNVLLRVFPQIIIGVTTERLFVGTTRDDAQPHESSWLSARLSALDIATVGFDRALSAEDVAGVVAWIARAGDATSSATAEPPTLTGCQVTKIDFSATRFRDAALDPDQCGREQVAWRTISRALLRDWGDEEAASHEAGELADLVLRDIDRQEGTGIGELTTRLVGLTRQLDALPDGVRGSIKGRLAELVAALSPELRGQLLTASPTQSPEKLEMLAELLDRLPRPLVLEVIEGLDLARGRTSHQFLSLMLKLTTVSAADARLAEALEGKCAAAGIPRDIVYVEAPRARLLLEELLTPRAGDVAGVNPIEYQDQLERMSVSESRPSEYAIDPAHHLDPQDPSVLSAQLDRIAILLLNTGGEDVQDVACIERLRAQLPQHLENGDLQLIADAAVQFAALSAKAAPVVAERAAACLEFFVEPPTVRAALRALLQGPEEPSPSLVILARAGQSVFAEAALGLLSRASDPAIQQRVAAILPVLDFDVLRPAVLSVYRRQLDLARVLLPAMASSTGLPLVADVSYIFLADRDPAVRLEAYRLLFGSRLSAARMESVLRKALEDDAPRVVEFALEELQRLQVPVGARAIAHFIDAAMPSRFETQQRHAALVLAGFRTHEALHALVGVLADRHRRLDAPARRVSRAVAAALERSGHAEGLAAARAWRRSPAGILSRVVGDGGDA